VLYIEHPDAEILRAYDHPPDSLRGWRATLAAKAWIDGELACFFVGGEIAERYILLFDASNDYRPQFHGSDMRDAGIGTAYEIDALVIPRMRPIANSVLPFKVFP